MKRLAIVTAVVIAASAAIVAPGAGAAVNLSFTEASHQASPIAPGTTNRGDEYLAYSVRLKNTGSTKTSAGATVTVSLPAGVKMSGSVSADGWTCHPAASTCSSSKEVAADAEYPKLTIEAWLFPEATSTIEARFDAYGGGAVGDAVAFDSLTLGPQASFGLASLTAGACSAPPVGEPLVRSCEEAEAQGAAPYTAAGGHPFAASSAFTMATHLAADGTAAGVENLRDLLTELPAGFIGNPEVAHPLCTVADVRETTSTRVLCPESDAVGGVGTDLWAFRNNNSPLYRVVPEAGYVAAFAFKPADLSGDITIVIRVKVRSNGDYGVSAIAPWPPEEKISELLRVRYATLCGYGARTTPGEHVPFFAGCRYPGTAGAFPTPFLTNQTRCSGVEPVTSVIVDSFQKPGAVNAEGRPLLFDPDWKLSETTSPSITGCNHLSFEPSFEGRPTSAVADAPSGFDFDLRLPQNGLLEPLGLAEAHLRDSTVVLPQGMVVNPAAATGLAACSSAQVGLITPIGAAPIHFSGLPAHCPDAAKLGTVAVDTPLLTKPLNGSVYLARQLDNPFGSLLALYIVVEDPETGVIVKLAGKVTPDPLTGQLTASFDENPQLPFEALRLHVFEGPRASLRTPSTCGVKSTLAEFTPWSAPESGPPAELTDSFETSLAPGGGHCPASAAEEPNAPRFSAGTISPRAGSYSPFVLRLARDDGSQEINGLNVTLPPGLSGRLAGVAKCSEAQIARAQARSRPGEGATEQADPSCPASSEVGGVEVTAGAGPDPFHANGRVYLAGPYKGAPISLAVITPAVAGPFDIGAVVIRNPLYVDPRTGQVTVKSDPIPTILEGIPLDLRSVEVRVSRDHFILNPTSCEPMAVTGQASGAGGTVANLRSHFQVGECSALAFRPNLRIQMHGATRRGAYQRLTATVSYPEGAGYANTASVGVTLPHSSFLAQEHIRTVCTRVQFAAKACPRGSIYGNVTATTPILDEPLTGPIYLRSSDHPLPDLVMALRGPDSMPIEAEVVGRVDSKNGGIRNRFELVPDVPLSKVTVNFQGGKKSLIVNSRDLCKGVQRATVRFTAQNGLQRNWQPVVGNDCRKQGPIGKKKRSSGHDR
jgi:hypothetical protein